MHLYQQRVGFKNIIIKLNIFRKNFIKNYFNYLYDSMNPKKQSENLITYKLVELLALHLIIILFANVRAVI